jgi:tetrahydrodipicolinate N-succinyltransferase
VAPEGAGVAAAGVVVDAGLVVTVGAVSAARIRPAIPKANRAVEKNVRKGGTLSELGLMYMKSTAENNFRKG